MRKGTQKLGIFNIILLGLASLFNDIGSEMILPILPFFITSLGGAGLAIGTLSGLREGIASLATLFGGWYSDRTGKKKPFVFFGYLTSVICRFLLIISTSWQCILGFVSLERIGKVRDAPRDEIIAKSTKKRGKGFGIQQMFDTLGAIFGASIVLILFWKLGLSFISIILIAGGLSIISLIPIIFVKEGNFKPIKKGLFKGVSSLSKQLKYFIFVMAVFTFVNFGLYMFLLLRVRQVTGSTVIAIALGLLFNFIWASFSIPFGSLSDSIGRKKVLMFSYVLFFCISLGFVYSESLFSLIILFILYGLVYAVIKTVPRAFVTDKETKLRGTALGYYQFIMGIVSIIGGIVAGLLWNVGYKVMFGYMTAVTFFSIILLVFVRE